MTLQTEIERLNQIPDDERKQAKFDHIIAVMQGEGGNFSAGIYISVLAAFATALVTQGFDPQSVILNISKATRDEIKKLLKDQGLSTAKPLDS